MAIEGFYNPFEVTEARRDELVNDLFQALEPQDLVAFFKSQHSLHENVYLWDFLTNQLIPEAQRANRPANLAYYQVMQDLLIEVINQGLPEQALYSLSNPVTGQLQIKHDTAYLLYTDRYKHLSQLDYQAVTLQDFIQQCQRLNVVQIVVTDGSGVSATLDIQQLLNRHQL